MCSHSRASLEAQRKTKKAAKPSPSKVTPGKVGRESLGQTKGKRKGFGPLEKWFLAATSGQKDLNRVEDEPGKGRGREILEPQVQSLRARFEEGGEAIAYSMGRIRSRGQDPDLDMDPGGKNEVKSQSQDRAKT